MTFKEAILRQLFDEQSFTYGEPVEVSNVYKFDDKVDDMIDNIVIPKLSKYVDVTDKNIYQIHDILFEFAIDLESDILHYIAKLPGLQFTIK